MSLGTHAECHGSDDQPAQRQDGEDGPDRRRSVATGDYPRSGGTFAPILIPKHAGRFSGFDDKIVVMYARGMTVGEIRAFLAEQYGTDVSADFISSVTDEAMKEAAAWQQRPLEVMPPRLA